MEPHVISYIPEHSRIDRHKLIGKVAKDHTASVYTICGEWFDMGQWDEYRRSLKQLGALSDEI